jgi:RNA polymerase sigma-70 factor (ECF subfamily)
LTVEPVNGRAGLALRRAGHAVAVVAIREAGARVAVLWIVLNPTKLRAWHRR